MPIYQARFEVTTYYTISIDAENYQQARDAANSIDFNDLEVDGIEDNWRAGCNFDFMSKTPIIQGEGRIFSAPELLDRYEEN